MFTGAFSLIVPFCYILSFLWFTCESVLQANHTRVHLQANGERWEWERRGSTEFDCRWAWLKLAHAWSTVILTGNNLKYKSNQSNIFWSFPFLTRRPFSICPPTIFTSDWVRLYKKMFPNRFRAFPQQNVPCICECVGTRVHYGDILNPSLSSICSSAAGTLGPAHLSSQFVLPGTATVILIGSHHQPLPQVGGYGSLLQSRFEVVWNKG